MRFSFDKAACQNTRRALHREWLLTNERGDCSGSSILCCNTRKYHGLLAVNTPYGRHAACEGEITFELHGGYGADLMAEVQRYSRLAGAIAVQEQFDVIHVHDWMTYPAGMKAGWNPLRDAALPCSTNGCAARACFRSKNCLPA